MFYNFLVDYKYGNGPLTIRNGLLNSSISSDVIRRNHSRPLFFVRVPKCGSENLVFIIQALQERNRFQHNRLVQTKRWLREFQQREIVKNVMSKVRDEVVPQSFDRHVFFINFSRFDAPFPIYVSLIRDPVQKMISRFFYRRGNSITEYNRLKRRGLVNVPMAEWLHWLLEMCVLHKNSECNFVDGHEYDLTIPYFCGHEKQCLQFNNRWALNQAMANLEKYFSVVGILEDMDATLNVLETKVPAYFKGVKNLYHNTLKEPRINANYERPRNISAAILQKLKSYFHCEYEFYTFAMKMLYDKK